MKMNLNRRYASLAMLMAFLCFTPFVKAGSPSLAKSQSLINNSGWSFRENKGQLMDEDCKPLNDIPFYGKQGDVNIYCKAGEISFVFTKKEQESRICEATGKPEFSFLKKDGGRKQQPSGIMAERADLELVNANLNAAISASNRQASYENYYTTGDANRGVVNVHTYKTITYKNIYTDIDLVLEAKEHGIEYSFVVHPGGNVADIQLRWNGLENIKQLENGGISYELPSMGALASSEAGFTETAPYSFQKAETGNQKPEVKSCFYQTGNRISFKVGRYDKSKTLVIDPYLNWGTYFGGGNYDIGQAVTTDLAGNVYFTGWTTSNGIATSGAFQTSLGGKSDVFLAKFSNAGAELWSTYYGGSNGDQGNGIAADTSGNVYVIGNTGGFASLATSGAYQTTFTSGYSQPFLSKFSTSGSLLWGTYFGLNGGGYGQAVAVDDSNYIVITGETTCSSNIVSSGVYQTTNNGAGDAYVAKFSSAGKMRWGTYFGGTGTDEGVGITTDSAGNIFITGTTTSTSDIASSGAYHTSYGGNYDAFIAKFNNKGGRDWSTYFGGKDIENPGGIAHDAFGNIYITGSTYSTDSIASKGAYQTKNIDGDSYLAKFNTKGSRIWATYYGGKNGTGATGVAVTKAGTIYITGQTGSDSLIATSGAYQTKYPSQAVGSAFLSEFSSAGSLLWGTYYSGNIYQSISIPNGIATDTSDNIYITGYSDGTGLATDHTFMNTFRNGTHYGSGGAAFSYAFLSRFNFIPKTDAGIYSFDSSFMTNPACPGKSYDVYVDLENYGIGNLDSVNINWSFNGVPQKVYKYNSVLTGRYYDVVQIGSITYPTPGKYNLKAWTSRPNGHVDSLPANDTSNIIITVSGAPITSAGKDTTICAGSSLQIGSAATSTYNYSWRSIPYGYYSSSASPTVNPTVTTSYYLTVSSNNYTCGWTDTVVVTVLPIPAIPPGKTKTICYGNTDTIGGLAVNGYLYAWTSSQAGFTSTASNPNVSPTVTTSYYLAETATASGCKNADTVVVTVNPLPVANAGKDTSVCNGNTLKMGSSSTAGTTYSWTSNPSGYTSTLSNPSVSPTLTTTYIVTATNSCGTKKDTVAITVNPLPVVNTGASSTICNGNTSTLGASPVNGDTYSWASNPSGFTSTLSNPSVKPASTSTYTLTEKITATGCSKSNSVIVTVNPLPSASFTATPSGLTVYCVPKSLTLSSYSWKFGDGSTSYSAQPSHVYSAKGTYYISLTVSDINGCSNTDSLLVTVSSTGIANSIRNIASVKVSPNPFTFSVAISYALIQPENVQLTITDITGKQIAILASENQDAGQHIYTFDADKYTIPAGIYFLHLVAGGETVEQKIVRIR